VFNIFTRKPKTGEMISSKKRKKPLNGCPPIKRGKITPETMLGDKKAKSSGNTGSVPGEGLIVSGGGQV